MSISSSSNGTPSSEGVPHFQNRGWQPLLTGAAAAAARDAVLAIAADLGSRLPEDRSREAGQPFRSPLARGPAGTALFFAYAHLADPDRGWDDACLQAIRDALATTAASDMGPGLFTGVTGVGWVLQHLDGLLFETKEDPGAEVESALVQDLARNRQRWPPELIGGLAGYGVYFLERLPRASARQGVERVIDQLAGLAEERNDAIAWFTPARNVPPSQLESAPAGCYNLGVSHGVPGTIGFLAAAHRQGVAVAETRRLLDGAVRWLLAQRLPGGSAGVFPALVGPGIEPAPTRLAWCYGDPGIAAVLLSAARSLGREDWEREALACARHAAGRRGGDTRVVDAGLCHGAAGLGHLFHRLFRATGDETLREAALHWLQRTLEMRHPGSGPGGFQSADSDAAGRLTWTGDPGFLPGAAGIGLALLAALSPVEPEWDRLLLLSL
ncbi:MAG TPA: lanthionine synthetase C family protein [Thermoanaerobaculia bacterium]|nr:lanthionine synthetase C family protein [Thermoanaerobaculia bacterium]